MTKIVMKLKTCAHCSKDIPSSIQLCPYCRYNEQGQRVDESNPAAGASESQIHEDVNQLGSDDPLIRKQTADRLLQGGPAVVPVLINVLNEHAHKGIAEAARLLGRFRDPRALGALRQALKIGDEELRISAVWSLSQLNDPKALDDLLQECERTNPTVQSYLAHALTSFQDRRIAPALIKLAAHPSREVSFQAICALGESGDPGAIRVLRRQLARQDPLIRAAAETGLKRLGGPVRRIMPAWVYGVGIAAVLAAAGELFFHYYR